MSQKESYDEFMRRVDAFLMSKVGIGHDDMADAMWYDLYEDMHDVVGKDFEESVVETISEADDMFEMAAEEGVFE